MELALAGRSSGPPQAGHVSKRTVGDGILTSKCYFSASNDLSGICGCAERRLSYSKLQHDNCTLRKILGDFSIT
jgi:hypothetical protein